MDPVFVFVLISSLALNAVLGRRVYTEYKRHKRHPGSIDIEAPAWRAQVARRFLWHVAMAKLPAEDRRLVKGVTATWLMEWVARPAPLPPAAPDALAHLVDDFYKFMVCADDPEVRKGFLIAILITLPELRHEKGNAMAHTLIEYFPRELKELHEEHTTLPMPGTVH